MRSFNRILQFLEQYLKMTTGDTSFKNLELNVAGLLDNFVGSLSFESRNDFLIYVDEIQDIHRDCSICKEEKTLENFIEMAPSLSNSTKNQHKSYRKSRQSVCVPKFILTSDSEEENGIEMEIPIHYKRKSVCIKRLSLSEDSDEDCNISNNSNYENVSNSSSDHKNDTSEIDKNQLKTREKKIISDGDITDSVGGSSESSENPSCFINDGDSVFDETSSNGRSGNNDTIKSNIEFNELDVNKNSDESKSEDKSNDSDDEIIKKKSKRQLILSTESDSDTELMDMHPKSFSIKHLNLKSSKFDGNFEDNFFTPATVYQKKKISLLQTMDAEKKPTDVDQSVAQKLIFDDNLKKKNSVNDTCSLKDIALSDRITEQNFSNKHLHLALNISHTDNDDDDFENFMSSLSIQDKLVISDDEDTDDDFIVDSEKLKTPKLHIKNNFSTFTTPKSAVKSVFQQFTLKSVAGTPAFKREFNKIREKIVCQLYLLFNETVFENKLPVDMKIEWNKRMTKTAGFCYYSHLGSVRKSRIELSDKVVDNVDRIRDTLIHELCHAALWLIEGVKGGHGPCWRKYANKANAVFPELPIIMRCHQYEINTKYKYQCNGCNMIIGRHSKSVDENLHRCAKCGGIPILVVDNNKTPRTPNSYAIFVKGNFASIKKNNPNSSHKEIMMKVSEKYHKSKQSVSENKENELHKF